MVTEENSGIGFFEKYLTVWVLICMAAGILIGRFLPAVPELLGRFEYAQISIPIAILIWLMIYPMMLKIDFQSIKDVGKQPLAIAISSGSSWLIKPLLRLGLAMLFFKVVFARLIPPDLAQDFMTGVILGVAPCTAMVFVWSTLTKGNPAYTLVQVAVNDILILFLFVPLARFMMGVSNISIPFDTLILSVVLFVVVPLVAGALTRFFMIRSKGLEHFEQWFIPRFDQVTIIGLLLTLVIIFTFQGEIILANPLYVVLIMVPIFIQNMISAGLTYSAFRAAKLPHNVAAPGSLIAASDFFELSVAVAIALFGIASPVVLATTVGVLSEVPIMLFLVGIVNRTKGWYEDKGRLRMRA